MARERTYLDWNATAPLLDTARDAMLAALALPGNASSVHIEGRAARAVIDRARDQVAALVGTKPAHVTFCSGATEAANMVLTPDFRMGRAVLGVSKLYVSAIEHPAVREGGRFAKDMVVTIPVTSSGIIDLLALEAFLEAHDMATGLPMVAVMFANNETGIVQPVEAISKLVKGKGGIFVCDAVQAAGRVPLSIADIGADFMIISAHKLGGPKGAGALISQGEVMMPVALISGGGHEKGHRAGTENVAAIAGFGAAAAFHSVGLEARAVGLQMKRDRFEASIKAILPDVLIHGEDQARIANTSFFSVPGLKSETGQIAFDLEGIALSSGSACSSGKVGESHVLSAMGLDAGLGALRMSIGADTKDEEIDRATSAFERIVARVAKRSSAA
jgi:cysteine desulfurase